MPDSPLPHRLPSTNPYAAIRARKEEKKTVTVIKACCIRRAIKHPHVPCMRVHNKASSSASACSDRPRHDLPTGNHYTTSTYTHIHMHTRVRTELLTSAAEEESDGDGQCAISMCLGGFGGRWWRSNGMLADAPISCRVCKRLVRVGPGGAFMLGGAYFSGKTLF